MRRSRRRATGSFIWENEYDEEEKINSYDLTLFIREEDDLYRRYQETHFERAWSLDEIKKALTEAGMEFVAAYDAFTKRTRRERERPNLCGCERTWKRGINDGKDKSR